MFGYVFAAKVGCGLVAEIGSMRISDEIDALESVGIDPMRYVIGTRLLAVLIFVPLVYIMAILDRRCSAAGWSRWRRSRELTGIAVLQRLLGQPGARGQPRLAR